MIEFYGESNINFKVTPFPLPYHDNAFILAESLYAIASIDNTVDLIDFMDYVFTNQGLFYNDATAELTRGEVVEKIATIVEGLHPTVKADAFTKAIGLGYANMKTRVSFKVIFIFEIIVAV